MQLADQISSVRDVGLASFGPPCVAHGACGQTARLFQEGINAACIATFAERVRVEVLCVKIIHSSRCSLCTVVVHAMGRLRHTQRQACVITDKLRQR